MGVNLSTFEERTNQSLAEMEARAYFRSGISEAARSVNMSNRFDFSQMLTNVKAGQKCRRASWVSTPGKYVYRAADDSTTLRCRDVERPEATSTVYHPTPDLFATDWEILVETCTFAEIVEHLRAGGSARRVGWVDTSGRTFIQRYSANSEEIWIYFASGTRQKWQPYAYEFLAKDWIKCGTVTSVGGVAKTVS